MAVHESMIVQGDRLLVKVAKKRPQKTGSGLVLPDADGMTKKSRRPASMFEAHVCGWGEGENLDKIHVHQGDRVAVGHTMAAPIMLNGEQFMVIDAEDVLGVVTCDEKKAAAAGKIVDAAGLKM